MGIDIKHYLRLKRIVVDSPARPSKKKERSRRPSRRHYVGESHPGIYLTQREFEMAILLVEGYRYKEIGQQLSLSHRTVEYYVDRLRGKFQCCHKKALVEILEKIDIIQ